MIKEQYNKHTLMFRIDGFIDYDHNDHYSCCQYIVFPLISVWSQVQPSYNGSTSGYPH